MTKAKRRAPEDPLQASFMPLDGQPAGAAAAGEDDGGAVRSVKPRRGSEVVRGGEGRSKAKRKAGESEGEVAGSVRGAMVAVSGRKKKARANNEREEEEGEEVELVAVREGRGRAGRGRASEKGGMAHDDDDEEIPQLVPIAGGEEQGASQLESLDTVEVGANAAGSGAGDGASRSSRRRKRVAAAAAAAAATAAAGGSVSVGGAVQRGGGDGGSSSGSGRKVVGRGDQASSSVVYFGRIPHGFYEEPMKEFLSQFGTVRNVRICRNPKTRQSRHFGFVQFESPEVAAIVADCMHNYLLFGSLLQVKLLPPQRVFPNMFRQRFMRLQRSSSGKRRLLAAAAPSAADSTASKASPSSGRAKGVARGSALGSWAEVKAANVKKARRTAKQLKRLREAGIEYNFEPTQLDDFKAPQHVKFSEA